MDIGTIYSLAILLLAVVMHEFAHGWVANRLGDPTARLAGRLTLNPIKHVDPIGTLLLPLMLLAIRSPVLFGWAKPVPVNFMQLRQPRRDMIFVGIAGPVMNIILACVCSLVLNSNIFPGLAGFLESAIVINLILAVFNMIPVPPLDGSRLVLGLLPLPYAYRYAQLEMYGMMIVFALLYFGFLEKIIWPVVAALAILLGVRFY